MHAQNQSLFDALNACIAACEHCATACLGEQDVKMMARCISIDRDCADICATECEKHGAHMQHCKECAEACRRCEQACRQGMSMAA